MVYVPLKLQAAAHFAVSDPKSATNNDLSSLPNIDLVKFNSKKTITPLQQAELYFTHEIYDFSVPLVILCQRAQLKVKKHAFLN